VSVSCASAEVGGGASSRGRTLEEAAEAEGGDYTHCSQR